VSAAAPASPIIETIDPNGRRVLDVSGLPNSATGPREPVWWGNMLMIFIETTTIVLLLISYLYIRRNFDAWPPPQPNTLPPIYRPVPDLPIPTVELMLALLSVFPMRWTHKAGLREEAGKVRAGLVIMFALNVVMIFLRFMELSGKHLKFDWDENAYASTVWTILGLHLTYLLGSAAEFFIMGAWIFRHRLDHKHGLDVSLAGIYWYWVVGTWVVCYAFVYWGARIL
jgi:heme/copper-type cytochrome/quinol oxidase subunit 3